MKNESGLVIWLFLFMWIFSPPALSEKVDIYYGNCFSGWQGWTCPNSNVWPNLWKVQYVIRPTTSKITYSSASEYPQMLEHCAIMDKDNWECSTPAGWDSSLFRYYCREGDCDFGHYADHKQDHTIRQLSAIEYYFRKFIGAVPDNAIMCYQNGHAEESIK